jgi:hypothetical protein
VQTVVVDAMSSPGPGVSAFVLPEFEVLPILCNYLEMKAEQPDNTSALLFIPSIVYLQCAPLLRGMQSLHKVRKSTLLGSEPCVTKDIEYLVFYDPPQHSVGVIVSANLPPQLARLRKERIGVDQPAFHTFLFEAELAGARGTCL